MNKTISIKNQVELSDIVENYLNPEYIYIPISTKDEILVKVGAKVLKEEPIIKRAREIVYSSISGTLIGTTESMYKSNILTTCLVIENDFKEKVYNKKGAVKYISEYNEKEVLSLIKKYLGDKSINLSAKSIVINGIDQDPYERTYSFLINNYCTKILEGIDAISNIINA